jgi:hypothetical protein
MCCEIGPEIYHDVTNDGRAKSWFRLSTANGEGETRRRLGFPDFCINCFILQALHF